MATLSTEFETCLGDRDFNVEVDVRILSTTKGGYSNDPQVYEPAEFEIDEIRVKCLDDGAPVTSLVKLTETQFLWLFPEGEDILNNAFEWAAENETDFYLAEKEL